MLESLGEPESLPYAFAPHNPFLSAAHAAPPLAGAAVAAAEAAAAEAGAASELAFGEGMRLFDAGEIPDAILAFEAALQVSPWSCPSDTESEEEAATPNPPTPPWMT